MMMKCDELKVKKRLLLYYYVLQWKEKRKIILKSILENQKCWTPRILKCIYIRTVLNYKKQTKTKKQGREEGDK